MVQRRWITRGLSRSPEYRIYRAMLNRCYNSATKSYHRYGGRGITVCSRWRASFVNFYQDMGPRPSEHMTLERKDNDGNYCKSNVVWATVQQQSWNRGNNLRLTYRGQTKALVEWCSILNLDWDRVWLRLKIGWTVEDAFTIPRGGRRKVSKMLTYQGVTLNIADWSRRLGVKSISLSKRLEMGWSVERTLSTPVRAYRVH